MRWFFGVFTLLLPVAAPVQAAVIEPLYTIEIDAEVSGLSFFFRDGVYADGTAFDMLSYRPAGAFEAGIGTGRPNAIDVDADYAPGRRAKILVHVNSHSTAFDQGYQTVCTTLVNCSSLGGNEAPSSFQPRFSVSNGLNQVTFDLDGGRITDQPDTDGIGTFSDALIPGGDPAWMTIDWTVLGYSVTDHTGVQNTQSLTSMPLPASAWMLLAGVTLLVGMRRHRV